MLATALALGAGTVAFLLATAVPTLAGATLVWGLAAAFGGVLPPALATTGALAAFTALALVTTWAAALAGALLGVFATLGGTLGVTLGVEVALTEALAVVRDVLAGATAEGLAAFLAGTAVFAAPARAGALAEEAGRSVLRVAAFTRCLLSEPVKGSGLDCAVIPRAAADFAPRGLAGGDALFASA